ncbi:efflux RND transporter periplasmic adaptor subunit [Halodesulfovibrio marinisediminis]|uniref:Membrane fusion protein, Cu(I)/Ag(I) efflux system n=1 Tax=Halodesulfovibrio marinisediminis DSM 17456 TaxID=1121457 RepID=A0A1N6DXN8_9BACT|nr:efflux RND transporter periplasmic adaptor subunit [Halodesulfovibrio marinisediminis]SIN75540.1 membrane fusion protein, Cu(I)/Ag(I) efflux system [Halodesulfovibrio marinisediminis DSM 17456]
MQLPRGIGKIVFGAAAIALAGGIWASGLLVSTDDDTTKVAQIETAKQISDEGQAEGKVVWTCSMHPQIQLPQPGKCPLCFMDLIKLEIDANTAATESYRQIELDTNARKLAEVEVTPVTRKSVTAGRRMVGKVDYDESRVETISAWTAGRIDRLLIAKTGSVVRKGQPMAVIYSPELYSAQAELIQATAAKVKLSSQSSSLIRKSVENNISAAKEKLRLLGLSEGQIAAIANQKTPSKNLTVYAPQAGIVIRKDVVEGAYVKAGQPLYSIADLSAVWVVLDAYETDLPWIKEGDDAVFTAEAFPGEQFTGRIVYIDPTVNQKTRTVAVRIEVANTQGKLKPGMFVQALQRKAVSGDEAPLVIPTSAPLITGKRAIVYVQNPEKEGVYVGREIVLGAKTNNTYVVKSGLEEGELVVSKGAFKLDSALQIKAKPSMMSDTEGVHMSSGHDAHEGHSSDHLGAPSILVSKLYFMNKDFEALQSALQQRDNARAQALFAKIGKKLSSIETWMLEGEAMLAWKEHGMLLANDCVLGAEAETFKRQHELFALAHAHYTALKRAFGVQDAAKSLTPSLKAPEKFKIQICSALIAYTEVAEALSQDNAEGARVALKGFSAALNSVSDAGLSEKASKFWADKKRLMTSGIAEMRNASDIEGIRKGFFTISNGLLDVAKKMGISLSGDVYEMHCPMAFDNKGATWLQQDESIRNPYFGSKMFNCGEVKKQLAVD